MNNTAVKIKKLDWLAIIALEFGGVESGPIVRSSYRAEQIFKLVVN